MDFAKVAAPLEACHLIKGSIEWTEERIKAFEAVKEIFKAEICLRHINWGATIYLTTDASLMGIGAWIGQKDAQEIIQPVICVSKKLSPTQQRWSATKRELYALMWAMNKLRMYLVGRQFIARVDHKPLVAMMKNPLTAIMEGWVDTINLFRFTTEYLPGEENVIADGLSRSQEEPVQVIRLCDTDVLDGLDVKTVIDTTALSIEAAMQWQAVKQGKKIPSPKECEKIMQETHALGHFSTEMMFRQIWKQGYWWPGIRLHLKTLVQSCLQCLRQDIKHEGFHPSKSITADNVWDHVEMDLIGPLPKSVAGNCWVMTLVDVCLRYTILRALRSKEMEEVAQALWQVICEYGDADLTVRQWD